MSKYEIHAAPRTIAQGITVIPNVWIPEHLIVIRNGGDMWVLNLDTRDLIGFPDPLPTNSDIKGDKE